MLTQLLLLMIPIPRILVLVLLLVLKIHLEEVVKVDLLKVLEIDE